MALFIFIMNLMNPGDMPSAIVSSFTGQISSVMIIETPKEHHTIIWFSEDVNMNGGDNELQKN